MFVEKCQRESRLKKTQLGLRTLLYTDVIENVYNQTPSQKHLMKYLRIHKYCKLSSNQ